MRQRDAVNMQIVMPIHNSSDIVGFSNDVRTPNINSVLVNPRTHILFPDTIARWCGSV